MREAAQPDLETRLLTLDDLNEDEPHFSETQYLIEEGDDLIGQNEEASKVRLNHATATLTVTMLGAGIMALPRAFSILGILPGIVLLTACVGLSFFSLASLVRCSKITGKWTYAELTHSQFGRLGSFLLQWSIILNNTGAMTVYIIIIGDVLVGNDQNGYSGLVTNLLNIHDPGVFYVSRPFVLAIICIVFLVPLVSLRTLSLLGPLSHFAVAVAASFVSSMVALVGIALFKGQLGDFHWLPTAEMLGGSSVGQVVLSVLKILPVVTMSFVCHYNILPIARNLERFDDRRISMVIKRSLTLCNLLFVSVGAGGYALFGSHTKDNILLNLTPDTLAVYLPMSIANGLCFMIRLGYCMTLLITFTMLNWSLRETLSGLFLKGVLMPPMRQFLGISYITLVIIYGASLGLNVWTAMSLTGATAAVFIAYILPGCLVLAVERQHWYNRVFGSLCVILGCLMSVIGVLNTLDH